MPSAASARDETVGKILLNLQRRFRAKAARAKEPGGEAPNAARVSVLARRALTAYTLGDGPVCLRRLARLARLFPPASRPPARGILLAMADRAGEEVTSEEMLLAVFLMRCVAEG